MASVNKVIIVGNLGRDPEARYSSNGAAICSISVATTYKTKQQDGSYKEETEWHRVVMFNRLAEIAGEYLRKGKPVYIEGRLRTRKWQGQDGQDRYTTEIIADQMQMLGGGDSNQQQSAPQPTQQQQPVQRQAQQPIQQQTQQPVQQRNYQARNSPMDSMGDMGDDVPF